MAKFKPGNYNPAAQEKVKAALAWAYRAGYAGAEAAAEEFAIANDLVVEKQSLGSYGDTLVFVSGAA